MHTGTYLTRWLDAFVLPIRAPSTVACYRRAIAALPSCVLDAELDHLDGLLLQEVINAKARVHPRAAQLIFAMLHAALSKAVRLHYLPASPLDACEKPRHLPAKAAVLTAPQLSAYLMAARRCRAWPLLLLMATCGLRRGEALGLQWSDIDANSGILHVRRQRLRIDGSYLARPLKSAASLRDLPLPAPVLSELAAFHSAQGVRALGGWFVDLSPEGLARAHASVLTAAGLPHVTLHGLRHSMATIAVGAGCPVRVLQSILGHSRYTLTADLYAAHLGAAQFAPHMANVCSYILGYTGCV